METDTPNPVVYANGLEVGVSPTDIMLRYKFNNKSLIDVVCSYSYFKSLVLHLNETLSGLENTIGHEIVSADAISKTFNTAQ